MAYEYEKSLKNRLLNLELDDYVEVIQLEKEYEELEEVYAKAKAYDEILSIDEFFYSEYGFYPSVEEHSEQIDYIIEKYKEDTNNE